MEAFKKVINPGLVKLAWSEKRARAFVKITYNHGCLSVSGVVGPTMGGTCRGGAGQMQDALSAIDRYTTGWSGEMVARLQEVWSDWHLNDWHHKVVPEDVLSWLRSLPETTVRPAWV